jgi:DNA-binding response OmpR family regulator
VELLARIRALARRHELRRKNVLEAGDLVLNVNTLKVFRGGQQLHLSQTEFRLLELLVRHAGRVVTRSEILGKVWGEGRDVTENTLDAFVRLLRKKVDCGAQTSLIQTHRGFGYSINAAEPS